MVYGNQRAKSAAGQSGLDPAGTIMAEVVVEVDPATIVAAITRSSVENLNLQPGDTVRVIVKATEVMIAK